MRRRRCLNAIFRIAPTTTERTFNYALSAAFKSKLIFGGDGADWANADLKLLYNVDGIAGRLPAVMGDTWEWMYEDLMGLGPAWPRENTDITRYWSLAREADLGRKKLNVEKGQMGM